MQDCRKCKDYRDCTRNHDWFHYGEIRWCVWQVIWVIENSGTLLAGNWPPNPDGSGYIDPKIKTGYGSEAYYTKPAGILAEVEYRLRRTGIEGKLLRAEIKAGETMDSMEPEARSALMYIKGWRRKRIGYKRWLREIYFHR